MEKNQRPHITLDRIRSLLFDEDKYVEEFVEAAIESFQEFSTSYSRYLPERNLEMFRKAGHKLKPVAQMLGLDQQLLPEYDRAKELLKSGAPAEELNESVQRIQAVCNQIIGEFNAILEVFHTDSNSGK